MKRGLQLVAFLLVTLAATAAQVQPAATEGHLPTLPRTMNYSLNYSQTAEFGSGIGDWQTSTLSGTLNYSNGKTRYPLSLEYGGGYNWIIAGPDYGAGLFQRLFMSQGMVWHNWNASLSNNVSYTPETPTFGFTGIPGIGEPIAGSTTAPPSPNQSILTLNTDVVDNTTTGQVTHNLNSAAIVTFGGSYDIFRFPNGDGYNTNTTSANGGATWRLDARNSLFTNYGYSYFAFPDLNFSFQTQTPFFGYRRVWSSKVTTSVSAGPQWTSSSDSTAIPSSTGIAANASLAYTSGINSAALSYERGVEGGAGYLIGGETDIASANYSRQFGADLNIGAFGSYMHTASLPGQQGIGSIVAEYGGGQLTRSIGREFSVFVSYSVITQSYGASLPGSALNQMFQSVGFGFGYTPRHESVTH